MNTPFDPSRRDFLVKSSLASGGLVLGFYVDAATEVADKVAKPSENLPGKFSPNAYISIATNGVVSIVSKQPDMGQGVKTSLPMIIAEELEVSWKDVVIVQGDLNPVFGNQNAGGSTSTPNNYTNFQRLGATARIMLIEAAALTWHVPASTCYAENSAVHHHPTKRRLTYGQLVAKASLLPVPVAATVGLKDPKDYRLLGKRIGGIDNFSFVTGKPLFGIDTKLPGMLYAVFEKCPVFAGQVVKANLDAIKALPGIRYAFVVEGTDEVRGLMPGVAIVADSTWAAFSARKNLEVTWDEGRFSKQSWAGFVAQAREIVKNPGGTILRSDGDVSAGLAGASKKVEAFYSYPFISHTCMEPQNCTAWYREGKLELWAPTQNPAAGQNLVTSTLGIPKENITLHITRSGGGFGRRLSADYIVEAAAIAKQVSAPVKLIWSREDDLRHDHYRAGGFHFMEGGLDVKGKLTAWHDHFVTFANPVVRDGKATLQAGSGGSLSGDEFPGRWVENCLLEQTPIECNIPMGPWRAPGSNVFAWVIQSFIDELAHAAARDPLEFRLEILGEKNFMPASGDRGQPYDVSRMRNVLKDVAEKAGWGQRKLARGQGQGMAFHFCHRGYVAQVAEVTVSKDGVLRVDRVVVSTDIGAQIVNLSGAEHQVQGSVLDGMSTLLHQELNIESGRMVQSNFHDYPTLQMAESTPTIEVHFIKTNYPVTGLGEPAFPPVAPAICNAIFAATGIRVRQLPLSRTNLSW